MDDSHKPLSDERVAQILALIHPPGHSTVQTINQNANGVVLLVAALMLGLNAGLGLMVLDQHRQIGRMQDHLTAIYMMAPHLQPKEP